MSAGAGTWKKRGPPRFGGRATRRPAERSIGDRPLALSAEATARWVAFTDLACRVAAAATDIHLAAEFERERHALIDLAKPGGMLEARALSALFAQADVFLLALPRQRSEFAPALKAVAEQAWRLVTPGVPGDLRHPSVGLDR